MMMYDSMNFVAVERGRFAELERKEERIEAVRRLYESGNCYTLDTALSALGIKLRGSERINLPDSMSVDPCEDDLK
jgi:hypothetical protein